MAFKLPGSVDNNFSRAKLPLTKPAFKLKNFNPTTIVYAMED